MIRFYSIIFSTILCVLMAACCTSQPEIVYTATETVLQYDRSQLKRAFVFLRLDIELEICATKDGIVNCQKGQAAKVASGFVIDRTKNYFDIITAAHFCKDHLGKIKYSRTMNNTEYHAKGESKLTVTDYAENKFKDGQAIVIAQDTTDAIDMCMIRVNDPAPELDIMPAQLADRPPSWGDYVFHVGAPEGIYIPGQPMIFLGVFVDQPDDRDVYIVSTFTLPGSSGGMIVNTRGQVVGMILEYIVAIKPHGGVAATLPNLRQFICNNVDKSRQSIFNCPELTRYNIVIRHDLNK